MSKNIILITADSVRADHMGLYGYESQTTPEISSIADTVYETAYANAPYTGASLPSLLRGHLPLADGHIAYSSRPTIPSLLEDSDYTTYLAHSQPHIARFELDADFDAGDQYASYGGGEEKSSPSLKERTVSRTKQKIREYLRKDDIRKPMAIITRIIYESIKGIQYPFVSDKLLFDAAKKWMADAPEPYFVWIHLMGTHQPYAFEPADFESVTNMAYSERRHAKLLNFARTHGYGGSFTWDLSKKQREYFTGIYDAAIHHFDGLLSEFIDGIDTSKAMLIITSDHGEELFERGHFGHNASRGCPRSLTMYDEMLKVPLILSGPETPDMSVKTPVSLVDIFPTIADIAEIEIDGGSYPGTSLITLADGSKEYNHREVISHATRPVDPSAYSQGVDKLASLRKGDWKYIYDERDGEQLYNVREDPKENIDVAGSHSDQCKFYRQVIEETLTDTELQSEDLTQDARARLQDLGYL